MDEGITYDVVCRSFRNMLHEVFFRGNAVCGMPLYFILEFFWCRLFGFGEYAMRSMNYIFAVLYLLGAVKLIRYYRLPSWSLLVFAANPFFLYYMNEARPYICIIVAGLWCFYYLNMYCEKRERKHLFLFFTWFWLGCAMHMMFVFMGVAYACMFVIQWRERSLIVKHHVHAWLCCFPFFIPLAILYGNLILRAPEVNASRPEPLVSILQIVYFFAGSGGLGWSRNALRCMDLSYSPRICIGLSLFILCSLAVFLYFIRSNLIKNAKIRLLVICSGSTMFFFIAANIVLKTRFWERHIAYLLPPFILLVVYICADMMNRGKPVWIRATAVLMLVLQCLSGIGIMLLDYYQKDDYRGAVEAARKLNPDHILFEGDKETFGYYGLRGKWANDISEDEDLSDNINISIASQDQFEAVLNRMQGRIVLILCEKYEFDSAGLYGRLNQAGTHLHSFSVVLLDDALKEESELKR